MYFLIEHLLVKLTVLLKSSKKNQKMPGGGEVQGLELPVQFTPSSHTSLVGIYPLLGAVILHNLQNISISTVWSLVFQERESVKIE